MTSENAAASQQKRAAGPVLVGCSGVGIGVGCEHCWRWKSLDSEGGEHASCSSFGFGAAAPSWRWELLFLKDKYANFDNSTGTQKSSNVTFLRLIYINDIKSVLSKPCIS